MIDLGGQIVTTHGDAQQKLNTGHDTVARGDLGWCAGHVQLEGLDVVDGRCLW